MRRTRVADRERGRQPVLRGAAAAGSKESITIGNKRNDRLFETRRFWRISTEFHQGLQNSEKYTCLDINVRKIIEFLFEDPRRGLAKFGIQISQITYLDHIVDDTERL